MQYWSNQARTRLSFEATGIIRRRWYDWRWLRYWWSRWSNQLKGRYLIPKVIVALLKRNISVNTRSQLLKYFAKKLRNCTNKKTEESTRSNYAAETILRRQHNYIVPTRHLHLKLLPRLSSRQAQSYLLEHGWYRHSETRVLADWDWCRIHEQTVPQEHHFDRYFWRDDGHY